MNRAKNALLIGIGVASIGVAGVGVAANTFATTQTNNGQSSLIDALVKKFNLNKTDVQKVFDEQHSVHQTEMKTARETALKQALSDKKINQEQYDHIVAAWKEIDTAMDAAGTPESQTSEQHNTIKTKMDALRDWMKQQNITPENIGLPKPGGRGHGGPGPDDSSPASSTSTNQ